ncbi:MAG TPA: hypothetical protein VMY18_03740 [Acidobacteriota bacterium]|nr:hypothetical protein [Acidobacteriota bacterium]
MARAIHFPCVPTVRSHVHIILDGLAILIRPDLPSHVPTGSEADGRTEHGPSSG